MAVRHPFWELVDGRAPYPRCAQTLGMKLLVAEPGSGAATVQFEAKAEFTNPVGNIQGGFLSAMLDDTIGPSIATILEPDQFSPTLELKVSFMRPARVGKLFGQGRVIHRGRSIVFTEAELTDADGSLIARASATSRIVRAEWEDAQQR
jgi:uncharacterized protein (TIGR00369 family)